MEPLIEARREGASAATASPDLGLTQVEVRVGPGGVQYPGEDELPWAAIDEIAETPAVCFAVSDGKASRVQFYSDEMNRFYSLMPTRRAPTMLLSGIPMHRIKDVDPHEDTLRKMRTIGPVVGRVLDTSTGLGYTAIEAAKTATEVVTVEIDPTVLQVARLNPWSRALFEAPNIRQQVGNAVEVVQTFEDGAFTRIFHDPPTMRIAGEMYSTEMYAHLLRVLRRGGRLYHYIGDLDSTSGRVVVKGVVRRLQDVGFLRVTRRPEAFGIAAYK